MDSVTLSTKYQLVVPRAVRERLRLRPGMKLECLDNEGVLYLVPERPMSDFRPMGKGASQRGLREKKERL